MWARLWTSYIPILYLKTRPLNRLPVHSRTAHFLTIMKRKIYSLFMDLILIETLVFAVYMAISIFSQGKFDSIFDWINLVFLLLVILVGGVLTWQLVISLDPNRSMKVIDWIESNKKNYWATVVVLNLILIEAFQDVLYFQAGLKAQFYPVFLVENQPMMVWASLIAGQGLIGLIILGWKKGFIHLPEKKDRLLWFSVGLIICFIVLFSGSGGLLQTNAPVTFIHVLVVLVGVIGGAVLVKYLRERFDWLDNLLQRDIFPLIVLWILAFFIWSGAEIEGNYFIDPPRSPNQIFTPTSDAVYYEIQAQRLLIGEGLEDKAQHSLYTYFLGGLHRIGGEQYLDIVPLQIAVLALIPFFLFKLASRLGSPMSGWIVSLLFILREHTALLLGDTITVSNVQVLMTEPMGTLGVAIVLYLAVLWLEDTEKSRGLPLLVGAVIGLVVLIRVELISLAIAIGMISLLVYFRKKKGWIRSVVMMAVTIGLVITPWVVRNYQKTGTIRLDKTLVLQWAVDRYTHQEEQEQPPPGVEDSPSLGITRRINYKSLLRIANHSGSSLQQTLLYLPSNHLAFGGLDSFLKIVPEKRQIVFEGGIFSDRYATTYTKTLPYWNASWDGSITPRTYIPIVFVMLMITAGVMVAWEKQRWVGLLPLVLMFIHIVTYAFFIGSGGRYIQVVDWVTLLYFSLGLYMTLVWIGKRFEFKFLAFAETSAPDVQGSVDELSGKAIWGRAGLTGLCILIALSIPIVESRIPKRYSANNLSAQIDSIDWESSEVDESDFYADFNLADNSSTQLFYGKALYPAYFKADEFIVDDRKGRVPPPGENRVVFYLTGMEHIWVSLPISAVPESFPHGADIVVLGEITRDSPEYLEQKLRPYLLAEKVYILSDAKDNTTVYALECDIGSCIP